MNCPMCGSSDPAIKWCGDPVVTPETPSGFHVVQVECCDPCEDQFHVQILDSEAREQILSKEH